VRMIEYDSTHPVFGTVTAFWKLLDEVRLQNDAFKPNMETLAEYPLDNEGKQILKRKLEARKATDYFKLDGKNLREETRIVWGWHGCNTHLFESIENSGFAAFSDLDDGYFAHGHYVALESTYGATYAMGKRTKNPEECWQAWQNEEGSFAVFLVACLTGYCHPITPCDGKVAGKTRTEQKELAQHADFVKLRRDGSVNIPQDCKWFGAPMKSKYNSHVVAVTADNEYNAGHPQEGTVDGQFHELVCEDCGQLLPIAAVYFKKDSAE